MKICFPAQLDEGLATKVFNHFGSAPLFVMHDTETQATKALGNADQHHQHGQCSPIRALGGEKVDAVVVGGIGAGAVSGLNRMGIAVYRAVAPTVAENLAVLKAGKLPLLRPDQCCGGHTHDGGCAH